MMDKPVGGGALTASSKGQPLAVLTLALQDEIFAIEARHVHEILDLVPITEMPGAPRFLDALINVRGKVVPLADMRRKLGMEVRPPTIDSRIIVVEIEIEGDPTMVGLRADKVYEMTELAADQLTDAPRVGMRWRPEFVRCVGRRHGEFMIVLDIERVFAEGENRDNRCLFIVPVRRRFLNCDIICSRIFPSCA